MICHVLMFINGGSGPKMFLMSFPKGPWMAGLLQAITWGDIYWPQEAQLLFLTNWFQAFHRPTRLYCVPCHPICHTSHNTGAICNWHNFGKYTTLHRPDKAIMFVTVNACLYLEIFLFSRIFENFVLLINTNQENEKHTSVYVTS